MGQPRIRHNDYTVLDVPEIGAWTPRLAVTVVIPAYGNQEKLDLVLAGLAGQTYPAHLLEVIVVDDGANGGVVDDGAGVAAIRLPEIVPERCRLVASAPGGWGSAHAVATGIAAAEGDVVLRLDADILVYREHVEAHLRWHHLADYVAVIGRLRHTPYETGQLAPAQVRKAVADGRVEDLVDVARATGSWVDRVIEGTDGLRTAGSRAFRVGDGATISFGRRLYAASGGLDPAMVLGGDTEFAYRLAQAGAVFVPDSTARCWHLGQPQMKARTELGRRYRTPSVGQRVPLLRDFRKTPGVHYRVPYVDVVVETADASFEDVRATVTGALCGDLPDVGVTLVGPWSRLGPGRHALLDDPLVDLRLLRETFGGDHRVTLAESVAETSAPAPFRFRCPAGLVPAPDALRRLIELVNEGGYGLVLLPFPRDVMLPIARFERTDAMSRALALRGEDEDLEDVIHDLFGVYWISGSEWALTVAKDASVRGPADLHAELANHAEVLAARTREAQRWRSEAEKWQKLAQVPLKKRLRQAVKRRIVAAGRAVKSAGG
jgi:GT2 family glycosyltransferase